MRLACIVEAAKPLSFRQVGLAFVNLGEEAGVEGCSCSRALKSTSLQRVVL